MVKVSERIRNTLKSAGTSGRPDSILHNAFRENNVTVLGSGSYGAAIEDDGEVFKIFCSDEVGYGAFLQFLKGKSSVLLPRVKTVGTFGNYTCTHIERLYPLDSMEDCDAYYMAAWISEVALNHRHKKYGHGFNQGKPKFPKNGEKYVNRTNMIGLIKKMVDWMYANDYQYQVSLDLHCGNFMLRNNPDGTQQVVITDPFCNS